MNKSREGRALVIGVERRHATLLLPGGQFRRVRMSTGDLAVGQECSVPARPPSAAGWISGAAVLLLCANLLGMGAGPRASAVVSLDINPSISLVVGGKQPAVIQASGKDPAGRTLLDQLPVDGMPVAQAVTDLTAQAKTDGYLSLRHPFIVLAAAFRGRGQQQWFERVSAAERQFLRQHGDWRGKLVVLSVISSHPLQQVAADPDTIGRSLLWGESHPDGAGHESAPLPQVAPLSTLVEPVLPRIPAAPPGREAKLASPLAPHYPQRPAARSRLAPAVPAPVRPRGPAGMVQSVSNIVPNAHRARPLGVAPPPRPGQGPPGRAKKLRGSSPLALADGVANLQQ